MEYKNERVLAYKLAQIIEEDKLSKVAGGGGITGKMTNRPSGAGRPHHADVVIDVTPDH